ncbi:undecaprenyl-diphosphatase [Aquipluma nitroreducens]|uniref:Undecaprenyl-diphosphatase n=1 Tax=Aquipluma nitroreducens TaxID=2010828 RepID=A0A5K7S6T6_9BACT|nr:undecaprenyl-diphosphate phosphatase [Aquipluma nitroreducens]BBE17252.1 undecaprenyl-diphosphatase [Aquipluma nitroreducens]
MTIIEAIVIAVVEGITEFLPISSTGHMIITEALLGVNMDEFTKAFTVNIQFGAILSVVVLYWRRFLQSWTFYQKLLVAFMPAAVIGLLGSDLIDQLFESVMVVAITMLLGGILLLFVDKWFKKEKENQKVTYRNALKIGFWQCIAMIPGVSRSAASIIGGMQQKLSRTNAAEFSFFLAVPTMAAASGYKLLKLILHPDGISMMKDNLTTLLIGNIVAFIVAMIAIKTFITFLQKHGFKVFGWYRIVVGLILITLLLMGVDLKVV